MLFGTHQAIQGGDQAAKAPLLCAEARPLQALAAGLAAPVLAPHLPRPAMAPRVLS